MDGELEWSRELFGVEDGVVGFGWVWHEVVVVEFTVADEAGEF